jgi:hypothetical protein
VNHHSHSFLACKTCLVAVPLAAIPVHFSTLKIHNYQARDVNQLFNAWIELRLPTKLVLLATADDLKTWPSPTSPPYPPPLPALPVYYPLHCTFPDPRTGTRCAFMQRRRDEMAAHCRSKHEWINPIKRGRPPLYKAMGQRLRQTGVGAELFRVFVDECQPQAAAEAPSKAAQDKTWAQLEAELDILHAGSTPQTLASLNTNARYPVHMSKWLEKTGWPAYLEGKDLRSVARLLARPTTAEPGLTALLQAFDELIDQVRRSILKEEVNIFALHRVNSFVPASSGEKVVGPFLPLSLQSLTLRWIPLEAKVEYLRSILEHKKHNPSMEMHLDFYCNWSDLGVDEETGERDDSKSKIDKDLRDLADEYGVKIGCAGGEFWRHEVN